MFIVLVDNGATQFRLIDLTGELIREFTAETGGTTYMLDVSSYAAGVYVLSLIIEGSAVQSVRVALE